MRNHAPRPGRRLALLSVMLLVCTPTLAGEIEATMFPLHWPCPWEQGFTTVDLDHDGLLDLVTAAENPSSLCVRLGLGNGMFGPRTIYEGGAYGFPVTADFNGDGNPDVVAVLYNRFYAETGDHFRLWPGNGDGTFGESSAFDSGSAGLFGVAVADFDENDMTDVVVANRFDGAQWHPGTGDGQFLPRQDLTPGELSWWVVVDDFDGDGHEDVVSFGDELLRLLLGHGDGTFTSAGTIDVPEYTMRGVSGDLDQDGNRDLVVLPYYEPYLSVLLGNGDGTFQPEQQYAVPVEAFGVAIGELTGDDYPDLAVGHAGDSSGSGTILPGIGAGHFGPAEIYQFTGSAISIEIADIDRDGHMDFLNGTWGGPLVLLNRGDGTFPSLVGSDVGSAGGARTVNDLDGDGALDIAVAPPPTETGTITIMRGGGDGTFVLADLVGAESESHSAIVTAELGQGDFVDLASADELWNAVHLYPGVGGGEFGPGSSLPVGLVPRSLAAGDVDGDDDVDLVTANWLGTNVSVLLQEPDGFAPEVRYTTVTRPIDVALGFVDGDANLDLVVVSSIPSSAVFAVHFGFGDGSFGSPMLHTFDVPGLEPYSLTLTDLDKDGALDVVVGIAEVQPGWTKFEKSLFFPGVGDGSFLEPIEFETDTFTLPILADIDGDGWLDAVNAGLMLGNGDGTFQPRFWTEFSPGAVGDFNGDGRTDLAGLYPSSVVVLLNDCLNADMRLEASGDSMQWRAVCRAQNYNVYRQDFDGPLTDADEDGLPDEGYGECISDLDGDPTDTEILDPQIPLPGGTGFGYLVSWVDLDGEGGLGATSTGLPREIAVPCP